MLLRVGKSAAVGADESAAAATAAAPTASMQTPGMPGVKKENLRQKKDSRSDYLKVQIHSRNSKPQNENR